MTPELIAEQEVDAREFARINTTFAKMCDRYHPLWNARIAAATKGPGASRSAADVGWQVFENSQRDLDALNAEIASMQARTNIMVAASSLMLAGIALKPTGVKSGWAIVGAIFLVIALLLTSSSLVIALTSLVPPIRRAWRDPYDKRAYHTLLVVDDYTGWVMNCWLSDRRTSVVTRYKKAHSIAVPLLIGAGIMLIPGLAISTILK
jgi:hypothetical protein